MKAAQARTDTALTELKSDVARIPNKQLRTAARQHGADADPKSALKAYIAKSVGGKVGVNTKPADSNRISNNSSFVLDPEDEEYRELLEAEAEQHHRAGQDPLSQHQITKLLAKVPKCLFNPKEFEAYKAKVEASLKELVRKEDLSQLILQEIQEPLLNLGNRIQKDIDINHDSSTAK